MNESMDTPETVENEFVTNGPPTAGTLLRLARERAGMHLGMLSVALKVPVRTLMALESDQHDQLTGPVFVRALAGSVCRHLKIDATEILALLPNAPHRLPPTPAALEMSQGGFYRGLHQRSAMVNRKFLYLALALMTLIALITWLPSWPTNTSQPVLTTPVADAAVASAPVVVMMPSDPPVTSAPTAATMAGAEKVVPSNHGQVPASLNGPHLVFKGKSDSWVEIKNSAGTVVFSQLIKTGEVHEVKADSVLNVVIGRADAVDVQLRGQAFDLTPFSRGAVARFEVK